jgi:hypothetical protein
MINLILYRIDTLIATVAQHAHDLVEADVVIPRHATVPFSQVIALEVRVNDMGQNCPNRLDSVLALPRKDPSIWAGADAR